MRLLIGLRARLRSLLRRRAAEQRMNAEFRFHIEMEAARLQARGLSPAEARRAALVSFGGEERYREAMREGRTGAGVGRVLSDARIAVRMLSREPSFTVSVLVTLALSIGATTAVFTLLRRAVLDPLPYPESGRLVEVGTRATAFGVNYASLSRPELADVVGMTRAFTAVAGYRRAGIDLSHGGRAERVRGVRATATLFAVLGMPLELGRAFTAQDDVVGGAAVVLLSHALWQRLGGDSTVLGRTLRLDGEAAAVIGVLPRTFEFTGADVVLPLRLDAPNPTGRSSRYLSVVARLAEGVSIERARAELAAVTARLHDEYPGNYPPELGWALTLRSWHDAVLGDATKVLWLLLATVVLVLLIACANTASLLLARAQRREQEMALRIAVGAGRRRLLQQLLTEGLVLALLGGVVGVLLCTAGTNALLALAPSAIPRAGVLRIDAMMLLTTLAVASGATILFGVAPALHTIRRGIRASQLASARVTSSYGWRRGTAGAMATLVTVEVALAAVVVIAAGLLLRSYARLSTQDLGFVTSSVLAFDITLPEAEYADPARVSTFYRELIARIEAVPGVERAGGVLSLPLRSGPGNIDIELEGEPVPEGQIAPSPIIQVVTPGYFETLRIPVLQGRPPVASDNERAPLVAWVNRTAAARLWPGESAIGRRFRFAGDTADAWFTIAGVVGDVRTRGAAHEPDWEYYLLHAQLPRMLAVSDFHRGMSLVVRSPLAVRALAADARRTIAELAPDVAAAQLEPMTTVANRAIARNRLAMLLLAAFAALAAVLAAVGIYGVLSYGVNRRRHEIGIRIALGARRADVVRMVVQQASRAAGLGIALGAAVAFASGRVLAGQLYATGPRDPLVFGTAITALTLIALLAAAIPALRASRVAPGAALREE